MLETQARDLAERLKLESKVPDGYRLSGLEKRYIEISRKIPGDKYLVRDFLVWIARFSHDEAWIELAFDDATGAILRTDRSR